MKKGSVVPSPAKRKRSGADKVPAMPSLAVGGRARRTPPRLGAAARDWELPDIGTASINAVDSWVEADEKAGQASAQKTTLDEKKRQLDEKRRQELIEIAKVKQWKQFQLAMAVQDPTSPPSSRKGMNAPTHAMPWTKEDAVVTGPTIAASRMIAPSNYSAPDSGASIVTNSTGSGSGSGQSTIGSPSVYSIPNRGSSAVIQSTASASNASSGGLASTVTVVQSPQALPATPNSPAVPKSTLYQFYGQKPRRKQLSSEAYHSWHNGAKPHELKFTAIFQCPITGECFPSGRYGDSKSYEVKKVQNNDGQPVEMVWFNKKTLAEHGAAAKCYDCILYRDALLQGDQAVKSLNYFGTDPPYARDQAPPLPPLPTDIAKNIEKRIQDLMGASSV